MKKLYEQAHQLTKDMEEIATNVFAYNPSITKLRQGKVLLETIQYDVATLTRGLAGLYAELGKKIKEDKR